MSCVQVPIIGTRLELLLTSSILSINRDNIDDLQVLASLPQNETVLEYLIGCWKRLYTIKLGPDREVRTVLA